MKEEVIEMYKDGISISDIADSTGLAPSTVGVYIYASKINKDPQAEERVEYLKERDYFIILSHGPFYKDGDRGRVVFRLSGLKDQVESFNDFHYKGNTEIVYRTNKWFENLQELI